jgi:hypothetical protein
MAPGHAAAYSLGMLCKYTARFDEGVRHYRAALSIVARVHGPKSVEAAVLYHNLGGIEHERDRGRARAASARFRRAHGIFQRALGARHPNTIAARAAMLTSQRP